MPEFFQPILKQTGISYTSLESVGLMRPIAVLDERLVVHVCPNWMGEDAREDFRREGRAVNVIHPFMAAAGFETPKVLQTCETETASLQVRTMVGHDGQQAWPQEGVWEKDVVRFLAALHSIPKIEFERQDALLTTRTTSMLDFGKVYDLLDNGSRDSERARVACTQIRDVFDRLAAKPENAVFRHNDFGTHNIANRPDGSLLGAYDFNVSVWGDYMLENFPASDEKKKQSMRRDYCRLTGRPMDRERLDFYRHIGPTFYFLARTGSFWQSAAAQVLEVYKDCQRVAPTLMAGCSL